MKKKDRLIRKVYMNCPICDKPHNVEEHVSMSKMTVHGLSVEYQEHFYLCNHAIRDKVCFSDGEMLNENLERIWRAYWANSCS